MAEARYWVIVASLDHAQRGVGQGFVQANHGKAAPLKRMQPGDWVLIYSPKTHFDGSEKLQAFTAIGQVTGEAVYTFDMGDGFIPARRDVTFYPCKTLPLPPLVPDLSFIHNKTNWGAVFRFGFFEIPPADFERIADQMLLVDRKTIRGQ